MANTYYTSMAHFEALYDASGRRNGFSATTPEEHALWEANLRGLLADITGYAKMSRGCDLKPRQLETECFDGYTRELWTIETEPGVVMPFYALYPDGFDRSARHAAVLAPHGHGSDGKNAVVGNRYTPGLAETIDEHHYDYAVQLVRKGFAVYAPDARGFGQRREKPLHSDEDNRRLNSSCQQINHMAYGLGQTVTGMWAFDLSRLVDYLETLCFIDAARIGCAGLSGGGLQTLWVSALDTRIACAVISGYYYGYKQSLLQLSQNCSCNYVPHLWEHVDMGDLGALIAPRPLLIETGDVDPLNGKDGLANVRSQIDISRGAYSLLGADDHLAPHSVFAGPHRWDGTDGIPWLVRWLKP